MISSKPALIFLAASVGIHTFVLGASSLSVWPPHDRPGVSVLVSYIPAKPPETRPAEDKSSAAEAAAPPSEVPSGKAALREEVVREMREFMTDPEKGQFFLSYFVKVKEEIHGAVRRNRSRLPREGGSLEVIFVLNVDGSLDAIRFAGDPAVLSPAVRAFAERCVREAAPFDAFPRELGAQKIAFRLKLVFEDKL